MKTKVPVIIIWLLAFAATLFMLDRRVVERLLRPIGR